MCSQHLKPLPCLRTLPHKQSYVATLELVEQFSGGSGLAISGVVIIRFMPSLLLAPVCGVVADRWAAGEGGHDVSRVC